MEERCSPPFPSLRASHAVLTQTQQGCPRKGLCSYSPPRSGSSQLLQTVPGGQVRLKRIVGTPLPSFTPKARLIPKAHLKCKTSSSNYTLKDKQVSYFFYKNFLIAAKGLKKCQDISVVASTIQELAACEFHMHALFPTSAHMDR